VALRAGVSTATVSRVLAGIGNPTVETANAVMAAVGALDYRPSAVARSLRIRRTYTLGLIVTDIQNPFFPELVQAADAAARKIGYSILLGSAAYDERRAVHYLDLMADHRVDGMIIASSQLSDESWRWLANSPVPAVVVNAEPSMPTATVITSDNEGGSRLATEHLIGLGHLRLAYFGGPSSYTAAVPRLAGFRAACRAAGLDPDAMPVLDGDGLVEGGERAATRLLVEYPDVTAVACFNDLEAIGALRAFRSAERRVPAEISVIGCDDIAAASWMFPALSTVAQQKTEMGRLAVERLVQALDEPDVKRAPEVIRLPMTLKVRESAGPPPARVTVEE
jgi:LacI family transcriptional regulator